MVDSGPALMVGCCRPGVSEWAAEVDDESAAEEEDSGIGSAVGLSTGE